MEAFQNKNKRPQCILAESGPLRSGNANVFAFKRVRMQLYALLKV